MRALTLKPHWAHAVAWMGKRVENRSRPYPPALLGQRIAIHAGSEAGLRGPWLDELDAASPWSRSSRRLGFGSLTPLAGVPRQSAPRRLVCRAIVATAVVDYCCPAEVVVDADMPEWLAWRDRSAAYWWRLTDVRVLGTPVPVRRGQLGLWTLSDKQAAAVAGGGQ